MFVFLYTQALSVFFYRAREDAASEPRWGAGGRAVPAASGPVHIPWAQSHACLSLRVSEKIFVSNVTGRILSAGRINGNVCVVDPHHIDADPDSTYHLDADTDSDFFYADPDPTFNLDLDPGTGSRSWLLNKGSNPWKSAKIGSYSIHFVLSSANWCGSGSGLRIQVITLMWIRIRIFIWCGSMQIRIHNTGLNF